jgi:hypothetical protein
LDVSARIRRHERLPGAIYWHAHLPKNPGTVISATTPNGAVYGCTAPSLSTLTPTFQRRSEPVIPTSEASTATYALAAGEVDDAVSVVGVAEFPAAHVVDVEADHLSAPRPFWDRVVNAGVVADRSVERPQDTILGVVAGRAACELACGEDR